LRDLSALEDDDRGDGADAELARGGVVGVGVELADFYFAGVVGGELFDRRGEPASGLAPLGPEIDQDGGRGFGDFFLEIRVRDLNDVIASHIAYLLNQYYRNR